MTMYSLCRGFVMWAIVNALLVATRRVCDEVGFDTFGLAGDQITILLRQGSLQRSPRSSLDTMSGDPWRRPLIVPLAIEGLAVKPTPGQATTPKADQDTESSTGDLRNGEIGRNHGRWLREQRGNNETGVATGRGEGLLESVVQESIPSDGPESPNSSGDGFGKNTILAFSISFGLLFTIMEAAKCYCLMECRRREHLQRAGENSNTEEDSQVADMPIADSRLAAFSNLSVDVDSKTNWVDIIVDGMEPGFVTPRDDVVPSAPGYVMADTAHAVQNQAVEAIPAPGPLRQSSLPNIRTGIIPVPLPEAGDGSWLSGVSRSTQSAPSTERHQRTLFRVRDAVVGRSRESSRLSAPATEGRERGSMHLVSSWGRGVGGRSREISSSSGTSLWQMPSILRTSGLSVNGGSRGGSVVSGSRSGSVNGGTRGVSPNPLGHSWRPSILRWRRETAEAEGENAESSRESSNPAVATERWWHRGLGGDRREQASTTRYEEDGVVTAEDVELGLEAAMVAEVAMTPEAREASFVL
ncbi:unnamed protein product [Choristocarpus tenellus]